MSRDVAFFLEDIENACLKILRFTERMSFAALIFPLKVYEHILKPVEI